MTDKPVVKYVGSSTTRIITRGQFKAAGVDGQKDVEWNTRNEFTLPLGDFNDEALEVLRKDKAFEVSDRPPAEDAVEVDTNDTKPIVVEPPKAEEAPRTAPRR